MGSLSNKFSFYFPSNMFPANLVQATFQQVSQAATKQMFHPHIDTLYENGFKYQYLSKFLGNKIILLENVSYIMIHRFMLCQIPVMTCQPSNTCGSQYRTQRVPELIPKPTVAQLLDETTTRRVYIYGIQDDNGTDVQNFSLDLTPPPDVIMKTSPGTSEGMNVLGIVIFSATMGE